MRIFLGLFAFLVFFAFSIMQLYAGFVGINLHLGTFLAFIALIMALLFRFTLPITIGAFFGAVDVWGWHWFFAILFVAPGLIFVIPGTFLKIISKIMNWLMPSKKDPSQVIIDGEKGED